MSRTSDVCYVESESLMTGLMSLQVGWVASGKQDLHVKRTERN